MLSLLNLGKLMDEFEITGSRSDEIRARFENREQIYRTGRGAGERSLREVSERFSIKGMQDDVVGHGTSGLFTKL